MKKHLKRILIGASMSLMAVFGFLIIFVLYPNNLFAKRTNYKGFKIYATTAIGNYEKILDEAEMLVKRSELYDSNYTYDIFLTNETFYKDITFRLLGPAMARSIDNNVILNVKVDFKNDLLAGAKNKRDLSKTIAHEMVHCLQVNKYGLLKFNPLVHPPLWKLEGYAEYIACLEEISSSAYSFTETVRTLKDYQQKRLEWVESKPGHSDPIIYFKGRVMMEYLINKKGMSYDQILSDTIKEDAVYKELGDWYASQVKN
ncbi:hypothetical protein [Arcticibacter tournemirensis]|uniref:Uncharacterized protein n=1 Tax=Arcticibacter tournemirensis TaxID=699437 RepID=A0A4Q0M2A5_9SPHI|nr:hypothetical protein [Arcticibacter tournemirensis]RXF66971.1 hypothetical protein EKH83_21230 [Arcticibacter tournemirensis]